MTTKRKATTAKKASPKTNASKADAERLEANKRRMLNAQFVYLETRLDRVSMVLSNLLFSMQRSKEEDSIEGLYDCELAEYIATVDLAIEYLEQTAGIAHARAEHSLKPEEREG